MADFHKKTTRHLFSKKLSSNNKAVSELIGTVLLLAITIATFTTLVLLSSSYFTNTPSPSVNLIAYLDGENIIIEHHGGESLSTDTSLIYSIGAQTVTVPLQGLDDLNSNNQWDLGERVRYSSSSINSTVNVRISVVDTISNTALFSGTLQDGLLIQPNDNQYQGILPIAQWKMDENQGSIAADSIGSNDGTITGATWIPGISGAALNFDGTDDYVEVPDSTTFDLTSALSLEAWVNPTGNGFSPGEMPGTILDTNIFGDDGSEWSKIMPIGNNIYAIVYEDWSNDGWIKTTQIQNDGTISISEIDSLEFDKKDGKEPDLIHISGDIYAIAYKGKSDDGYLATIQINTDGTIQNDVIDTLEFDTKNCNYPDIIQISETVFAIAYESNGNQGYITTVEIDAEGTITSTLLDSYRFDSNGEEPSILQISSDIYAIAYQGDGSDGYLKTLQIDSNGIITPASIDTLEFDTTDCAFPDIIHIADDVYAIAFVHNWWTGHVTTVEISETGEISNSIIDTFQYESSTAMYCDIEHVDRDIYAIAYLGQGDDGFVKTIHIQTDGTITNSVIDSFEYETQTGYYPSLKQINQDTFVVAYTNQAWKGALKTFSINDQRGIYKIDSYGLDFNQTTAYGFINDGTISASLESGWNHVVLTYDKDESTQQQKLYINGILAATASLSSTIRTTDSDFIIGDNVEGILDEVSLYDQALSLQEIQSNYAQGLSQQQTTINLTIRVDAANDDAEERINTGNMYLSSSDLELIEDARDQEVGIRFNNINIPKGSIIQSAKLTFIIDEQKTEITDLNLHGHDVDNSQGFSSDDHNITSRVKTSNSVSWDSLPILGVGESLESPDISAIIQEIINREGWSPGNSLSIIITGSGKRTVESYEGDSQKAPLLTISYSLS